MIDTLQGLTSLTKGDLAGIRPLAIKLGGFPTGKLEKLEQFIKVVRANKDGISFKSAASSAKALVAANSAALVSALPLNSIPGGALAGDMLKGAMEDPKKAFDPKTIFNHFANSRGTMGMEEFSNIFKQLGLPISHAKIMQMFSIADKDKKGELNYQQFLKALESLKGFLITEIMDQLGFSIKDMAISFLFAIVILILMFAFIFVGMAAFSPASSFSSVTNSMMPLGAGGAVNKKEDDKQGDD